MGAVPGFARIAAPFAFYLAAPGLLTHTQASRYVNDWLSLITSDIQTALSPIVRIVRAMTSLGLSMLRLIERSIPSKNVDDQALRQHRLKMLFQVTTLVIGLLPLTLATRDFVNHGTTDGWNISFIDAKSKGYVKESTTSYYSKSPSLKFYQEYLGTSYTGRYHSEVKYSNGYKRDEDKYYGFAFHLHSDWVRKLEVQVFDARRKQHLNLSDIAHTPQIELGPLPSPLS